MNLPTQPVWLFLEAAVPGNQAAACDSIQAMAHQAHPYSYWAPTSVVTRLQVGCKSLATGPWASLLAAGNQYISRAELDLQVRLPTTPARVIRGLALDLPYHGTYL